MSVVTRAKSLLGGMTYTDWAFVHLSAAFALLWALPFSVSATLKHLVGAEFLIAWSVIVFVGSAVAIGGIIMASHRGAARRRGFIVEAIGQALTSAGPLSYIGLQIGLWAQTDVPRPIGIGFAYLLLSAIICRLAMIYAAAHTSKIPVAFPLGDE